MNTAPLIRLHLFFATQNSRAVILRQGPSAQFRMILWDRATDQFEDGQWLKSRVYVDRCDLSPDGTHFLYFAMDAKWAAETRGTFTAITIPPYWTALALFPLGDTWAGGGAFLDNEHYLADGDADIIGRAGHLTRVFQGEPSKDCRTGIRLKNGVRAPLDRTATRRILADPLPTKPWEWRARLADVDPTALDRYDTQGGKLYRRHGMELELIRDFTDMEFERIRAPYDWRPEGKADWHPLRGES